MKKRSESAKDTEVVGEQKPRSKELSRLSVVKYILALIIVVVLFVLLSFAMRVRNDNAGSNSGDNASAVVETVAEAGIQQYIL